MHASMPLLLSAALLAPLAQDPRPADPPAAGQSEARLAETIEREALEIARAVSEIARPTLELARVKAVEARELASEVETWAAQAAQAGREAFLAGREVYEHALASNQDPEERITRALEAARVEVERLQAELERSRVARRQADVRRSAERFQLDALDETELRNLRLRIEERLQRQGQLEDGAEPVRRWRVARDPAGAGNEVEFFARRGEPGVAPIPPARGLRIRRGEGSPIDVQVEALRGLGYLGGPSSVEVEVEGSPEGGERRSVRIEQRPGRAAVLAESGLSPLAEGVRGHTAEPEHMPRLVEILRQREGSERPARIVVHTPEGGVRVIETEGLEVLDTLPAPPPPPLPPTAVAPRAVRANSTFPATPAAPVAPVAPVAPAQDTQAALAEVTNLVREMVSEVRDLRASLEELRAQVQDRRGR